MSDFHFSLLSEAALYAALALVAARAASAEKQFGRYHESKHLRRAAFLYFGLAAAHLLYNA